MKDSCSRRRQVLGAAAAALLALCALLFQGGVPAPAAPREEPKVAIAFTKNAYWYGPEDTVVMRVTLDNKGKQPIKGVSARVRIYTANTSREDLDSALEGKPKRPYRFTRTFEEDLTLKPGGTSFTFELPLADRRFPDGVYPLSIEALRDESVIASVTSELIVMSQQDPEETTQLQVSLVFDVLEPPHKGVEGEFVDNGLAAECNTGGKNPGWLTLLTGLAGKPGIPSATLSLSPLLLEELYDMTDGYIVQADGKQERVAADSMAARDATEVLAGFKELAGTHRFQFVPTPYASPELEKLIAFDWLPDAEAQASHGLRITERLLETTLGKEYFFPPGLNMNSRVIEEMGSDAGNFTILSPDLLERTREGRRILRGMTLGPPVEIKAGKSRKAMALFADGRLESLVKRLSQSDDPHGVAQTILSELTNLYLERPGRLRACVMLWPSWWRPSREVFDQVLEAIGSAPWLKPVTVSESFFNIPPLADTVIEIPETGAPASEYFAQVGLARQKLMSYSKMVLKGNPLVPLLENNLFISESDVWRQWDRLSRGLDFARSVTTAVDGELAKLDIPSVGSVTLMGGKADIPLSVTNGTGYRVKADLVFASNGLEFPDGHVKRVTLEPKENMFEIPVQVKKKGRVRFSVRLESNGEVLARMDTSVLTSRFNTFAFAVVGGLLGLIVLAWGARVLARRKAGKHKRRRGEKAGEEE